MTKVIALRSEVCAVARERTPLGAGERYMVPIFQGRFGACPASICDGSRHDPGSIQGRPGVDPGRPGVDPGSIWGRSGMDAASMLGAQMARRYGGRSGVDPRGLCGVSLVSIRGPSICSRLVESN